MNFRRKILFLITLISAFLLLQIRCTTRVADGGVETGNPRIVGTLYYTDGSYANGAVVKIHKKTASRPDTSGSQILVTDSVVTNKNGKFIVDTIDTGNYVIDAGDPAGRVAMKELAVAGNPDSTITVLDTLRSPGAISGTVILSEGGDPRKIFVLAYDLDRFVTPDSSGKFVLGELAHGVYHLLIISTLDNYGEIDMAGVSVASGDTTNLGPLILPFTGIPTPRNLKISYDTLKQLVTLAWSKEDTSLAKGFNVYRRKGTNGQFAIVNKSLIADTLFSDSLSNGLEKGATYQYYVVTLDKNNNMSQNSSSITVVIAYYVDAGKDTTFQVGDSVKLKGVINTAAFTPAEYRWDANGDGINDFISTSSESMMWMYTDTGTYKAVFTVKGTNNAIYTDTVKIRIVPKDTTGAPSAPRNVRLSYDTLKQIVTLAWSPDWEKDVTGYDIYRSTVDSSTVFARINSSVLSDTGYVDTTTALGHTYSYRIVAKDAGGLTGAMSPAVQFTGVPHSSVTTAFSITYDTLNETVCLHLRKPDTAYIRGYAIYRRDVAAGAGYTRTTTTPVIDTLVFDAGLVENKTYEYRLAIIVKDGSMGKMGDAHSVLIVPAIQQTPVVKLSYDTLKQIVMLTWNKADTTLVKGYNVYRRNVDSNTVLTRINTNPITDSIYRDSTGIQDQTYEYRVAAVDKNATEGPKSARVGIKMVSAFELLKTISLGGVDPFRFAISKDSLLFVTFRYDTIIKVYNQNGDSIRAFGQGQFRQPYGIALDSKGNVFIADPDRGIIIKFTENGIKQTEWRIDSPTDIAVNQNDEIYVLCANRQKIVKLDSLGNKQDSIALSSQTYRLVLDVHGNINIVDQTSFNVKIYNSNLILQNTLPNIPFTMLEDIDNNGNLYFQKSGIVGQSSVDYIYVLSRAGAPVAKWGYFNLLTDFRISKNLIYLLNYNENPWHPQLQIFKAKF
jgi:fibronectin type 3 domain-containing protein